MTCDALLKISTIENSEGKSTGFYTKWHCRKCAVTLRGKKLLEKVKDNQAATNGKVTSVYKG